MVEVFGQNFRLDEGAIMNDEATGAVLLDVSRDEGHGVLVLFHHLKEAPGGQVMCCERLAIKQNNMYCEMIRRLA